MRIIVDKSFVLRIVILSYIISYRLLLLLLLLLLFTPLEFFISAPANGHPLEFERHQVSSCLKDYSQYSGRSQ